MSYSESSMSLRAGACVRVECRTPEVSVVIAATDRRVWYAVGDVCCLRAGKTLRLRRTEGGGRGWSVRRRVADDRRNISPGELREEERD